MIEVGKTGKSNFIVYFDNKLTDIKNAKEETTIFDDTKMYIKDTAKEVEGDIQKEGAQLMKRIGTHIKEQAETETNKESGKSLFKATLSGALGCLCAVGIAVAASATLPILICAGIIGGVAGAGTGIAHSVMKISQGLTKEAAANNFIRQAEHTKSENDKSVISSKNPIKNLALMLTDTHTAKITKEQIEQTRKELNIPEKITRIYLQKPVDTDGRVTIYHKEVNVEDYDNVGDDDRNFKGRVDIDTITVDRAFYDSTSKEDSKGLLGEFIKDGKSLSESEKIRFIEIAKALSTDGKYKTDKKDSVDPEANEKEDGDFFDLNGDGKINIEDLEIMHQFLQAKINKQPLYKDIGDNMKVFNLDLNKDGKIDFEDENIALKAYQKLDINADGKFNKQDEDILIKYLLSIINATQAGDTKQNARLEILGIQKTENPLRIKKALNTLENQIIDLRLAD